jgi:hypothetical protein
MPLTLVPAKEVSPPKAITKKEITPIRKALKEIPLIEAEEIIPAKLGREPTGVKPIIPTGDTCCVGVCTNLNSEIDSLGQAIKIRQDELKFLGAGSARMKTRRQVAVLTTKISTLKDYRFTLLDKNICKCIELPKK